MRVDIKIRDATKINIRKWNKPKTSWKTLSLIISYHPTTSYKTEKIEKHAADLIDFVNEIPLKNEIIIGADINAAIGIRELQEPDEENDNDDTINDLISLHGNPRHNESGTIIREVLRELDYSPKYFFW